MASGHCAEVSSKLALLALSYGLLKNVDRRRRRRIRTVGIQDTPVSNGRVTNKMNDASRR